MLRITLISGLLISLLLLARAIAVTWQEEAAPVMPVADKARPAAMLEKPGIAFYPRVPAELPDLNLGYLFNEARMLVVEPKDDNKDAEPMIAIADVFYIGSVISSDRRVGIIGYPDPAPDRQQASGRMRPGEQIAAVDKHAQLSPGEIFSGYQVIDVLPEKIIFEKEGIRVEKSILKANKVRRPPMPQMQAERKPQGRQPANTLRPGQNGGSIRMSDPDRVDAARPSGRNSISSGQTERMQTTI